jgi:hypothetical protein
MKCCKSNKPDLQAQAGHDANLSIGHCAVIPGNRITSRDCAISSAILRCTASGPAPIHSYPNQEDPLQFEHQILGTDTGILRFDQSGNVNEILRRNRTTEGDSVQNE